MQTRADGLAAIAIRLNIGFHYAVLIGLQERKGRGQKQADDKDHDADNDKTAVQADPSTIGKVLIGHVLLRF